MAAGTADLQARAEPAAPAPTLRSRLLRPVWLPRPLYAAVPWVYLGSGAASLAGGLWLPDDTWFIAYLPMLGFAGLHAGLRVAGLRRRGGARRGD